MSGAMKMPDFCSRRSPFRFTTALNTLSKMGIDINRIGILAVGEYENYKGEVIEQTPAAGTEIDANSKIALKVGFPSPVDQMPYQFFYGFETRASDAGDWETRARELMAPFDSSVIRCEAHAALVSLVFMSGSIDREHLMNFLDLYDFELADRIEDMAELLFWASLLPLFNRWAGNPDIAASVIGSLFGYRCRIVENVGARFDIPERSRYRLGRGNGRLGRDSLVGGSFRECDTSYEITLMNVRDSDLAAYLPGKPKRQKLKDVIGFCMPSNLSCKVRIRGEEKRSRIGEDGGNCFLGYSSFI